MSCEGHFLLKQINSERSEIPVQNKLVLLNSCADLSIYKKDIISFLPAFVKFLKRKTKTRIVTIIIPFVNIVFNRFSKWIASLFRLSNTYTDCLCSWLTAIGLYWCRCYLNWQCKENSNGMRSGIRGNLYSLVCDKYNRTLR